MSEGLAIPILVDWSGSGSVPKAGGTMTGTLNMGSHSITNVSTLGVTNTTNQLVLGTTNTVTINSTAPSASRVYTVTPIAGNGEFSLTSTSGSSKIPVSYESVSAVSGTSISLTAAQLATGICVLTFTGSSPYTLTLPSGANIAANSALAPFNTAGTVFKVLISETGSSGAATLTGSTGCNVAGASTIVLGYSRVLYFVAAGSSVWNVY